MRIREIYFRDFRCFRGEHRISFVDPVTDQVRPVTVLGGSNGTGKTTVLDAIEGLLSFLKNHSTSHKTIVEVKQTGLIALTLEVSEKDLLEGYPKESFSDDKPIQFIDVAVGQRDLVSDSVRQEWTNLVCNLVGKSEKPDIRVGPLPQSVNQSLIYMDRGEADIYGGLIYFPYDRKLIVTQGGAIEPSPRKQDVISHFSNDSRWQGSLEQLWVWQNYLDLEQGTQDRQHLEPFVKSVETILGKNRRIQIKEGRVTVPAGWGDNGEAPRVRLDQLPSGEQQVLLLFGELARRRRPGCIIAIDEIENSLHPTLQRLVMWNLRRIAREWDAQVIVTTHSAEIINTVRGGAFINLDYPDDQFDLPLPDGADEAA